MYRLGEEPKLFSMDEHYGYNHRAVLDFGYPSSNKTTPDLISQRLEIMANKFEKLMNEDLLEQFAVEFIQSITYDLIAHLIPDQWTFKVDKAFYIFTAAVEGVLRETAALGIAFQNEDFTSILESCKSLVQNDLRAKSIDTTYNGPSIASSSNTIEDDKNDSKKRQPKNITPSDSHNIVEEQHTKPKAADIMSKRNKRSKRH